MMYDSAWTDPSTPYKRTTRCVPGRAEPEIVGLLPRSNINRDSRISLSGRNSGVVREGGFDMFWKLSYAKIVNVASVCDEFPAASVEITVTTS